MLFGNRAEGAGCAQLFDYITLITELWLLGSGLDDVFVGRSGKPLHLQLLYGDPSVRPKGPCGILRIPLYDHEQRNVRSGLDLVHAKTSSGIVLQL